MKITSKIITTIVVIILFLFLGVTSFVRVIMDNPSTVQGSKYARRYQKVVYQIAESKGVSNIYEIFLSIMIEESNSNQETPNKMGAGYDATTDPHGFHAGIDQFIALYTYAQSLEIHDLYHVVQAYHFENLNKNIAKDDITTEDVEEGVKSYLDYIYALSPTTQYSEQIANNYAVYVKSYINEDRKEAAREKYKEDHKNGCSCHMCSNCNYKDEVSERCTYHKIVLIIIGKCKYCTYKTVFKSRCDSCNQKVATDANIYANDMCSLEDIEYNVNITYAKSVCNRTSYNLGYNPETGEETLPEQGEGMDGIVSMANYYVTLGTPYVSPGSNPPNTFDCSSFTNYLYGNAGISIPRVAYLQYDAATLFYDMSMAQPGDLIFFKDTRTDGEKRIAKDGTNVTHVGIYIGSGYFIHASSGKGKVVKSSLSGYYEEHFAAFGRY